MNEHMVHDVDVNEHLHDGVVNVHLHSVSVNEHMVHDVDVNEHLHACKRTAEWPLLMYYKLLITGQ